MWELLASCSARRTQLGLSAAPQALLLALRLWARMPAGLRAACALLPAGAPPPPETLFTALPGEQASPVPAAAALFAPAHLYKLSPALLEASGAHPRVHSLWATLLALLLPGFTPAKVCPPCLGFRFRV